MYRQTLEYIRRYRLLEPEDQVVVGISGGADSVCLLILLNALKEELSIHIKAVHVHHGLRGAEADRDAEYSRELSERLFVPFVCVRVDAAGYAEKHGISVEEAGRILRYEALERALHAVGDGKIAVAHHSGDQAETILYNLFRGTGLKGLGGMRPMRDHIIRPILWADKAQILAYLAENGEGYCEDSTNIQTEYLRNRLRHEILPLIRERVNLRAEENILYAGGLAAEADRYFEEKAQEFLNRFALYQENPEGIGVGVQALLGEDPLIRTYVIRRMMERIGGSKKDITHIHVEQAAGLLEKAVGKCIDLPYGQQAVRTYEELWIISRKKSCFVEEEEKNSLPSLKMTSFPYKKGQEIPKNGYTKWFDYDKINSTLSVRYRQAGDYLTLAGGGKKTVKAFFIDEKVPKEEREKIPLVADGSHILWVIGYRVSEYYKITDETKTVLQIQRNGGEHNG